MSAQVEPRDHPYVMAHVVYRDFFFRNGFALLQLADEGKLADVLRRTWDELGERLGEDKRVASDGLSVLLAKAEEKLALFVELPEALGRTEAHRICMIFTPPEGEAAPEGRYFTLERAFTPEDEATTALCEWVAPAEGEAEPSHVLHGFEVPDDAESMAEAILALES